MRTLRRFALAAVAAIPLFAVPTVEAGKTSSASIDPRDFVREVDNPYFPLEPGSVWTYEGEADGVPNSNVTEVLHRTKTILGVRCTVVLDRAYEEGVLIEDTLDFYAQDRFGNVWYFGEDTKELDEDGNVVSTAGTWEAGVDGATPGIVMEANPQVGDEYPQENAPGVAEDRARVVDLSKEVCVPYGCFDTLVTKEWTPLEPKVAEKKYYAAGIGLVFTEMVKGGDEVSLLVDFVPGDDD